MRPPTQRLTAVALATTVALALPAPVASATSAVRPVEDSARPDRPDPPQDAEARRVPRKTWTFGRSVEGRRLRVTRIGHTDAPRRTLVVGCLHGNECDGVPVLRRLARSTPPPGTAYYLVRRLNPDGARRGTRQNARGVDLNRNFRKRWAPNGRRWSTYYPGPRPMSEPETRAAARLVKKIRPTFAVWYHQRMDLVDFCGGSRKVGRTYARVAKQRFTRITHFGGTASLWEHARHPDATILTVELPDRVTRAVIKRHTRAVRRASARVSEASRTPRRR